MLLLFDTNSRTSFGASRQFYDESLRTVDNPAYACCGFVGSKRDGDADQAREEAADGEGETTTSDAERAVSEEEARALCDEIGAEYFEVDLGVDDERVDTLFDTLIRRVVAQKSVSLRLNNNT